ncbi:MAG TPA: XRE family transcriptional regulator, partial [Devosia sp.]|nr:XRE family transcriptional regulator [Devosia sp.]
GRLLSDWRKRRRFSQLSFGLFAEVSPRHISFLETGRARPSRQMVLKLADCLEMPKGEVNRALLAAGYAPAYQKRPENDADLAPVHQAIDSLLENHMPCPGIVLDRDWNITRANAGAVRLLAEAGFGAHHNLLEALAEQSREVSSIVNWDETVGLALERVRTEIVSGVASTELAALEQKLASHFQRYGSGFEVDRARAVIPTKFRIGEQVISVFSTMASFGSVQDLALADLKVELMFPLDEVSESYFKRVKE